MLHQESQRTNMQGRFKPERPNLSHTDLHPEITKGGKDVSSESSWEQKKQHADIKANDEEEVVKYMSKLPSYLERGAKKPQEKVLNVGVLEWGRLEKWQGSHKQISHRSSISSLSSSNTSSSLSTDESSARSSTGQSCSPGHQRLQRPSLESHPMSVPKRGHLQFVKPFRESSGKFQDLKTTQRSTFTVQEKFIREKSSCKSNPHIKPDKFKRREMLPKIVSESGTVPNGVKDNMVSCEKVKMKNQRGEFMKKADTYQEVVGKGANQDVTEKRNTVVLLLPGDLAKKNHSGAANLSDLTTKLSKEETEPWQRTITETFKEAHRGELSSSFYHSGPLRSELGGSKHLQIKAMGLVDANNNGSKSERSQSVPCAAKVEICSSRSRNLEEKIIHATNTSSATNEACKGLETEVPKVASEKVRSTSPFRRFSFSMGKIGKSSGLKEGSSMPQMSSTCSSAKTKPENLVASGVDTSCGDKLNAKSRARSSPLRRLIEPLLKPKAVNCRSFTNQLQESIVTEGGCKSSERTRHSTMTMQPAKVKSDTTSTTVNDSALNKKCGSSAVQALLRVQVKNGLPLLTFAVDNESNILAATVKMLSSSSKGDYGCIYTFFAVKEVRKKNGMWINQGGKGKGQDYAPKIVAQMKVSGSEFSHLSRPNHVDQFSIREFVLLTLDIAQAHTQASDSQPNDEQAAIIVKIPKKNSRNSIRDGYLIDKRQSLPEATSKECLPDVKLELNSGKKDSFEGVRDINATVILPSGVHSLPNKGEPSSLIQRWKSGGACDCGGWDLGCKLRILSNKSQCNQRPSSLRGSSISNQFELFFQGGAQDNMPFFSLASFNDGIYSVEFNSSLSLMQAFSICIAVWDSGKHCELSESVPLYEERTLGETILNDGTNEPNQIEGEGPARQWSVRYLSPMKNKK
ncbi:hypothetical protein ES319_A03G057400v1 [Gossypium barbadense]|uniref:DUF3527 domain-containing protein n=1 Tax=Gossypium barbadense TaxID=3634 RepID=A0A5J5W9P5_GOSBA|nr:hypothetical protein ES319_A03G057400v1 [Gossypium barbadense]